MSKAANIYWDNGPTGRRMRTSSSRRSAARRRPRTHTAPKLRRRAPRWLSWVIVVATFVMLTASINLRSFREMSEEAEQNTRLSSKIQNLMDENLALQEEIHTLKSDPRVIEREAKRIGMDLKSSQ